MAPSMWQLVAMQDRRLGGLALCSSLRGYPEIWIGKRNDSHSIGFSGSVCHRSAKASGREDLVAWGRARCSHEPVSPPPRRNRAGGVHRTRLPRDGRLPLPALPRGLAGSSRSLPPPPSDGTMECPDLHRGHSSYWTRTTSIPWRRCLSRDVAIPARLQNRT